MSREFKWVWEQDGKAVNVVITAKFIEATIADLAWYRVSVYQCYPGTDRPKVGLFKFKWQTKDMSECFSAAIKYCPEFLDFEEMLKAAEDPDYDEDDGDGGEDDEDA